MKQEAEETKTTDSNIATFAGHKLQFHKTGKQMNFIIILVLGAKNKFIQSKGQLQVQVAALRGCKAYFSEKMHKCMFSNLSKIVNTLNVKNI